MGQAPKILLIDRPHPVLIESLEEAGFRCDPAYDLDREALLEALPGYMGVVMRSRVRADRAFLARGRNLRFLAREGVGTEHIDRAAAEAMGIEVITSPEGSRDTVAEHALGLLLGLMNHLPRADREVRAGHWRREPNRGTEIHGKTVGILGYGNIGTAFAQRLRGFDCRVIAYDRYKVDYGDAHAEAVDLPTLQRHSDILSIHIPYTPENHYFLDGTLLDGFARPIYLLNTARGGVLHTADLVQRLRSGQVLGAGLDVVEYEETSFDFLDLDRLPAPWQYLVRADNVVLSPHIAGWSFESKAGHGRVLAGKIIRAYGHPD